MKIHFTVPGKPMGKQRPRVLKSGVAFTPNETVNYETTVKWAYISQYSDKPLEGPIAMNIRAYFAIPKSTSKNKKEKMETGIIRPTRKPDMDNIVKIIADALNGVAYRDDSQIVKCSIEKLYSDQPRVEIEIEEVS